MRNPQNGRPRGVLSNPQEYRNTSKNLRNFVGVNNDGTVSTDSRKILQQGLIKDEKQNVHNVEQIIKYLQGDRFRRWIEGEISKYIRENPAGEGGTVENPFDPSNILNEIQRIWNFVNNIEINPGGGGEIDTDKLVLTVNGSQTGVTGNPYNPQLGNDQNININLFDIIPENPFYPMKLQIFEANTPNGVTEYNTLNADTQVILVSKMLQNANGIRFTNINTGINNERVVFVHMYSGSPYTDNVQVQFMNAPTMNVRFQEADLVFISGNYCMYQPIGSGGAMT
jgi:hypothetical protein